MYLKKSSRLFVVYVGSMFLMDHGQAHFSVERRTFELRYHYLYIYIYMRVRLKKNWGEVIGHDMTQLQFTKDMTLDGKAWRSKIRIEHTLVG